MTLHPISLDQIHKIAEGIDRPEDVVVGRDGRVFASDHQCAVAEIHPDGRFTRLGPQYGAPNGISMDLQGRILIANFGIYDRMEGPLERFDPATGRREVLVSQVGGRILTSSNYPVLDSHGNIWCANSTHAPSWPEALDGRSDGFIFVLRPDGSCQIVADDLKFPNGLAISADEKTLYCAQTSAADVLAFDILRGGKLSRGHGPQLGRLLDPGSAAAEASAQTHPEDLGYTDGVGVDAEGNVWVCLPAANKIVAITTSGTVETVIHDPTGTLVNHPTNVSWGGADLKDLYIGSIRANYVLKTRSPVAGLPHVHQKV